MKIINFFYELCILLFFLFKFKLKKTRKLSPNHGLKKKLIVSFTSKKSRFLFLHLMIESLFDQTIHPDEIILWIDLKEKRFLPKKIFNYCGKGLQIKFCKNLKSYNKFYYVLKKSKNTFLITFDDDVVYNKYSISHLIYKYKKSKKNYVIANRIHKIRLNNNLPKKYINWEWNSKNSKPDILNFQTGVFGVLYPPKSFYRDVGEKKIFLKLSPFADDIWLYWMIRLQRKKILWSGFEFKNFNILNFDKKLNNLNVGLGRNDNQIENLTKKYGFSKK